MPAAALGDGMGCSTRQAAPTGYATPRKVVADDHLPGFRVWNGICSHGFSRPASPGSERRLVRVWCTTVEGPSLRREVGPLTIRQFFGVPANDRSLNPLDGVQAAVIRVGVACPPMARGQGEGVPGVVQVRRTTCSGAVFSSGGPSAESALESRPHDDGHEVHAQHQHDEHQRGAELHGARQFDFSTCRRQHIDVVG